VLRYLKNNGMFVRNKFVLSNLMSTDTFVFDKTGTLTDNKQFNIKNYTNLNQDELREFGLVSRQSVHPYSTALATKFAHAHDSSAQIKGFYEVAGKGWTAGIDDRLFKVGSAKYLQVEENAAMNKSSVHVSINGVHRGHFELEHSLRTGVNNFLTELKSAAYKLFLSSGDSMISEEIDIQVFEEAKSGQSPENKVQLVRMLQNQGHTVAMTGDGLNDAPALNEANVAIAVADNENSFFPSCDVLIKSSEVTRLPNLMKFIKLSKQTLIFSF